MSDVRRCTGRNIETNKRERELNMFTTPCFIRKNTSELRDELEKIGRKVLPELFGSFPCLTAISGDGIVVPSTELNRDDAIDCEKKERLFLALAALRDDDDYMQYFWYKDVLFLCKGHGSTIKMNGEYSLRLQHPKGFCFETMNTEVRKATVEELIEYFKLRV